MLRRPFGLVACPSVSPRRRHPQRIDVAFRVSIPKKYRPTDSAIPLCRWIPSLGCAVFLLRTVLDEFSLPAASSLRVRVPPECRPTTPSQRASAHQHLSWASVSLQHMRNRGSTSRRLFLPALVRLQGLATLLTVCAPRIRAGFVSHRQRSWDSPFGA
jgi:hypothetical protein